MRVIESAIIKVNAVSKEARFSSVSFCSERSDQSFDSSVLLTILYKSGAKTSEKRNGTRHPQVLTCSSDKTDLVVVVTNDANKKPPTFGKEYQTSDEKRTEGVADSKEKVHSPSSHHRCCRENPGFVKSSAQCSTRSYQPVDHPRSILEAFGG